MEVFNEKEVLKFLVSIRNSILPIETKAVLRDLFLDYVATENDEKKKLIREMITNRLNDYPDFKLDREAIQQRESANTADPESTKDGLGQQRPSPSFQPVTTQQEKENVEDPIQTIVNTKITPTEENISVDVSTTIDNKARINQIKHDVNSVVGNPVNLISKNEVIGKEYMTALLEAMKNNSDNLNDDASMQRLEAAYSAVKNILNESVVETSEVPKKNNETPIINNVDQTESLETETLKTDTSLSNDNIIPPAKEISPDKSEFVVRKTEGLYHRPIDEALEENNKVETIKKSTLNSLASTLWKKDQPRENSEVKEDISPQTQVSPSVRKVDVASDAPVSSSDQTHVDTKKPDRLLKPLKEETVLPDRIEKLKNEATARVEAAKQPITDLQSPLIEDGLKQLLSEWSLFRSSGMFGTGPSGIEHPLYKQLANLPMASVVAGRFEGASPSVKQQLTDYMNGWRYERGIIHEMGETFDHYLRRVIKQILEHQRTE